MRVFLLVLVLIFTFQSWTKADDISDFELEGMSVGDSLLDHFSEAEIKNNFVDYDYADKTMVTYEFLKIEYNYNIYDIVIVNVKEDDKKYIIQGIGGTSIYEDIDKCYKEKNNIAKSISNLFPNAKREEKHKVESNDPKLVLFSYVYFFTEKEDRISVECYDFSESFNHPDQLRIGIFNKTMWDWLNYKAY